MEILKNVQLLDDSYLAEVSGGDVNLKGAQAKEGFAKFISSPAGIIATAGAAVTTVALTVLGTIFLPKTPRLAATIASKGWFGKKAGKWGRDRLVSYAPVPTPERTADDFTIVWKDAESEDPIPEGLSIVAKS